MTQAHLLEKPVTWFASQIYAEPTQSIASALASHPVLSKGLYLLKGSFDHEWPIPRYRHGLPEKGLLVVREVCNPESDNDPFNNNRYEALWHGDAAISWAELDGPLETTIILPPVIPARFQDRVTYNLTESSKRAYPPVKFLRFLKNLSMNSKTPLTYYHHESGAGWSYEQEFAWLFGTEDRVYVSYAYDHILEYSVGGTKQLPATVGGNTRSILMLILHHFGLDLPMTYFAPHTRDFTWNKFKLSNP
jgi:hypothetical protein